MIMNSEIVEDIESVLVDLKKLSLVTEVLNVINKVEALKVKAKAQVEPVEEAIETAEKNVAPDEEAVVEAANPIVDPKPTVVEPVTPVVGTTVQDAPPKGGTAN